MGPKSILVVDDEQDVVTYLSTLLADAGYHVTAARDGKEGLEQVRLSAPDLVSLDITMPEKTGIRFYREMREDPKTASIPIVIVTGVTNPWAGPAGHGGLEKFLATRKQVPPPDAYFEKPIDRDRYLARIKELIGAP